jgi:hypothetical protein
MKVIMLDIDGVLNSREWDAHCAVTGGDLLQPAPKMVIRLLGAIQDVAAATGEAPQIVLTSSWRSDDTMMWPFPLYSKTPRFDAFGPRWKEIEAWFKENPVCLHNEFVIVDDEPDAGLGAFADRFVQTDSQVGLTAKDAAKIVGLFT